MKNILYVFLILSVFFMACENQDWEFQDFEYQSVYFSHQYPVRTITLGDDIFDTSLDNEWKCKIMATTGGVYENKSDVIIDVEVDNSMANGMVFGGSGDQIMAMPDNYYSLASNKLIIPKGEITGGVEVQLTDAFFADPLAIGNTYVIPVKMTKVQNADTILAGVPLSDNPKRAIADDWAISPKDYVFYAVKYINQWHGYYLRRGEDIITGKNGNTSLDETITRHEEFVVDDEIKMLSTNSLNEVELPLVFKDAIGNNIDCTLLLSFDGDENCTISSNSTDYTATGSGKFIKKGAVQGWGGKDRDVMYLSYEIDFNDIHVETKDTLVMRNRGVSLETFEPVVQ